MSRSDRRMERHAPRQDMSGAQSPLSQDELRDVEVKHYAVIQAAAAIAVRELEANVSRRQAEFRNIISLMLPIAFLVGGWFINDSLSSSLDERVDARLDERSEQLLGYVELRSLVEELEGRMDDIRISNLRGEADTSASLDILLARFGSAMDKISPILEEDAEALENLSLSLSDVENLRWRILAAYDKIGESFRAASRYDHMVEVYRLAGSSLLNGQSSFVRNFAFGSGMMLLDEANLRLGRDVSTPVQQLYDDHQTALLLLRDTDETAYHALFSVLLDAKLGASDEELRVHSARIDRLIRLPSDNDPEKMRIADRRLGQMVSLVGEAGIDAFQARGVEYPIAGAHIYRTILRGCGEGAFLPQELCDPLLSGALVTYERGLNIGADESVGPVQAVSVSLDVQKSIDPLTGHITLTQPLN